MFKRFFGESEAEQIQYLQVRTIITLVSVLLCFFDLTSLFALVMLFVWGWNAVKSLFGFATIGAIFSGNAVFGCIIFIFYIVLAYCIGLICAALGTGRYIYLKIKTAKNRK